MSPSKLIILLCFVVLIGVPLLVRPGEQGNRAAREAAALIIITPHNEQIRYEFARAFDAWHQREYGQPVNVIYNVPGGTSEILKMLQSQFLAAIESGREPGGDADLVFGGGSFEHGRLKRGVRVVNERGSRDEPISTTVEFSTEWLAQIYGENRIGDGLLYDPDLHWFGLALSGFGIVFNRDALATLEVPEPRTWSDLCHPRLQSWVALVNPNQSGSVTTAFEAILKREGWENGWRILRRAGANARYFSASSLKPPIDVSQSNAAVGVCIDFFGRYQSQALKEAGDADRIGYIDPIGGSTIDADPISMLRNAPNPEIARRFIEFCLSDEGQALWQFPRVMPSSPRDSAAEPPLGPHQFELRRMPIVRSMYDQYFDHFIDQVNPFEMATPVEHPNDNFRDFIAPLFAAIAMDNHHDLRAAWRAIVEHPAYPAGDGMVRGSEVDDPVLRDMLRLFDAMPTIDGSRGETYSLADESHLAPVRSGWLRGGWQGQGLWHPEAAPADELRKRFGAFFRENYRRIAQLAEGYERER